MTVSPVTGGAPGPAAEDLDDGEPVRFPASLAQEHLWFIDQLEQGAGAAYNESVAVRLRGTLDADLLQLALVTLARRH